MARIFTTFFGLKGGQGKTTLAVQYALNAGGRFYTSATDNTTRHVFGKFFPSGHYIEFGEGSSRITIEGDGPHVLDLDKGNDERMRSLIRQSLAVVVPVVADRLGDLTSFQATLKLLAEFGGGFGLIAVVNNIIAGSGPEYRDAVRESISESAGKEIPVVLVNKSSYIERFTETGIPVSEMKAFGAGLRPLKTLRSQLDELFAAIDAASGRGR
jgi:MinD-like ATPase involved in chromosome partitioning or flagellar assembly